MREQEIPQETTTSVPDSQGPGTRLRKAREARGMTAQEVAAHLHLHTRTIQTLEADDFDNLPSPIYIRGYLRNYAKLLQLDGDELVAAYDRDASHDPQLTPPLKPPPQASSSDKPVKAMTYLLSLTLVLLLLAWWQSRHIGYMDDFPDLLASKTPELQDDDAPEQLLMPGLDYPITVVRHPDTLLTPRPAQSLPATDSEPAPTASETGQPAALLPIDTFEPEPAAEPPVEADTPVSTPGLKLELTAESWIEVYDADGKRLYHGMGRPGQTLEFEDNPPLRVILGYAPGVSVSYRGEQFDPEPHSSAGVARFQLGN
jgi:cytoskeleton protein RodZ